jgi:hypothetical protein
MYKIIVEVEGEAEAIRCALRNIANTVTFGYHSTGGRYEGAKWCYMIRAPGPEMQREQEGREALSQSVK